MNNQTLVEDKIKETENRTWKIPQCCMEGWESCTHVVKPTKKKKTNIGL